MPIADQIQIKSPSKLDDVKRDDPAYLLPTQDAYVVGPGFNPVNLKIF